MFSQQEHSPILNSQHCQLFPRNMPYSCMETETQFTSLNDRVTAHCFYRLFLDTSDFILLSSHSLIHSMVFKINFYWGNVASVSTYSKVNQGCIYIHALFVEFRFQLGHHRALSRAPCATQFILYAVYFFFFLKKMYLCLGEK